MADILYLTHRIPYPPDKGDKVRSHRLLQTLLQRHRVRLGTFIDDPADRVHVPTLRGWCEEVVALDLPRAGLAASAARSLWRGEALSLSHHRRRAMSRWVAGLAARRAVDAVVVFSSAMAPYALESLPGVPMLLDLVDLDSAKWAAYAQRRGRLAAWVYRREARLLGAFERQAVRASWSSSFVAEAERGLFLSDAPDCADRVRVIGNGVDTDHFDPGHQLPRVFESQERAIVFTGAMDYWPNEEAVTWFAQAVLPALVARHPHVRFHIVGRSPSAAVRALASPAVKVSGTVPDVRPYLQQASVVVAPLKLARGIQNKVLEAMAMAAPVVAAHTCVRALGLEGDEGVAAADDADSWERAVEARLLDPASARVQGQRAREVVRRQFDWAAHLQPWSDDLAAALEATRHGR